MRRLILASVLITVLAVPGLFRPGLASAHDHAPSLEDIDIAKKTTNLLFATLFAALTQEFDETNLASIPSKQFGTIESLGQQGNWIIRAGAAASK